MSAVGAELVPVLVRLATLGTEGARRLLGGVGATTQLSHCRLDLSIGAIRRLPQTGDSCLNFLLSLRRSIVVRSLCHVRRQLVQTLQKDGGLGDPAGAQLPVFFVGHLARFVVKIQGAYLLQKRLFARLQCLPIAGFLRRSLPPYNKGPGHDQAHDDE